jgi:hypothetical protein
MNKQELLDYRNDLFASNLTSQIQIETDKINIIFNDFYNSTINFLKNSIQKMYDDLEVQYNEIIHKYSKELKVSINSMIKSNVIFSPVKLIRISVNSVKEDIINRFTVDLRSDNRNLLKEIIPFIDNILNNYTDLSDNINESDIDSIRQFIDVNWQDTPPNDNRINILLEISSSIINKILDTLDTQELKKIRLFVEELLISSLSNYSITDEIINQFIEYSVAPEKMRISLKKLPKYGR